MTQRGRTPTLGVLSLDPGLSALREHSSPRTPSTTVGARSRARIEEELARLEGVLTASVERSRDGHLGTVHVTANPDWPVETVRRDVEAVLLQRFSLQISNDLIDIVGQGDRAGSHGSDEEEDEMPTATETHRLVLDTVHLALRAHGTSVGVDLLAGNERLRGTAGPVPATGVLAGVVDATIDALRQRLPQQLTTVVADVVEAGGDEIAIATLVVADGRSRHRLTGSAIVRGNVEDAMARATLDATNRLVSD